MKVDESSPVSRKGAKPPNKTRKNGGNMRYIKEINRKNKIVLPEYIDNYITENNIRIQKKKQGNYN